MREMNKKSNFQAAPGADLHLLPTVACRKLF